MEKGGISAIVATVLTILITVAGVVIIWMVILPMFESDSLCSDGEYELRTVSASGYPIYDVDDEILAVQVEGHTDGCYIEYIKVIINFEEGNESSIVPAPESEEPEVYFFNVSKPKSGGGSSSGDPESVQVAPVLDSPEEPEVSPPEDVNLGDIEDIPEEDVFDIGEDYIDDDDSIGEDFPEVSSGYGSGNYGSENYGE